MSYAKKAKKGYYGIAEFKGKDGKRHQKSAGCFRLKREAIKSAQQLEDKYSRVNIDMQAVTFANYYQNWFSIYKENSPLSDITKSRYRTFSKTIAEYFKDTKLVDIKRSTYQRFINWYGVNHAFSSVSKLNGAIRACVSYAIDDDIITKDFTHNVQLVYNEDNQTKVEYLTNKEIKSLKQAVVTNLSHYNTSRYMILTAIYTGMRKSEIQALTWNDIDFLHSTISISKSWDDTKKALSQLKRNQASEPLRLIAYCLII